MFGFLSGYLGRAPKQPVPLRHCPYRQPVVQIGNMHTAPETGGGCPRFVDHIGDGAKAPPIAPYLSPQPTMLQIPLAPEPAG